MSDLSKITYHDNNTQNEKLEQAEIIGLLQMIAQV